MRLKRGDLEVVADADGATIAQGAVALDLDTDEVRWLAALALPTVLCAPSDLPAKVDAPADGNGQVEGQTTIEDVLGAE